MKHDEQPALSVPSDVFERHDGARRMAAAVVDEAAKRLHEGVDAADG